MPRNSLWEPKESYWACSGLGAPRVEELSSRQHLHGWARCESEVGEVGPGLGFGSGSVKGGGDAHSRLLLPGFPARGRPWEIPSAEPGERHQQESSVLPDPLPPSATPAVGR